MGAKALTINGIIEARSSARATILCNAAKPDPVPARAVSRHTVASAA